MRQHKKQNKNDRILKIVLLVSAALIVLGLLYTLIFSFSGANLLLLLVLALCVGVCLPSYWTPKKKK